MNKALQRVHSAGSAVTLRVIDTAVDHATIEMGVDYSKAAVPERSYFADYCNVEKARTGFALYFGKLIPGTSELRNKIEIAFPERLFSAQLWGSSRSLQSTIERIVQHRRLEPVGDLKDTDKVQSFRSNNAFMGCWGDDSVLDFYYISPRDMHDMVGRRMRTSAELEPIVRVSLATSLMLEFLEKCEPFVNQEWAKDTKTDTVEVLVK